MLSVNIKKKLGNRDGEAGAFTLDVEFVAPQGVTILFGASGSGKTTTLKSIAGILRPDSGRITIDDQPVFDSERRVDLAARKRNIGYVFQNLALFPHLSVRDNVEFAMTAVPRRERQQRALEIMSALQVEHTANRKPRDISGGEAQRVALARALSSRPKILLLDEPLSATDEPTKLAIMTDLKRLNRELCLPIIYVTHSREEAVTIGGRVIVYERGRVVAQGEPLDVFGSPVTTSVARLTGVENLFAGRVAAVNQPGGMMTVEIADEIGLSRLEVPFGSRAVDEQVRIAVPSGDILLATEQPRSTSARNILLGHISAIEDKGDRTIVSVASGVLWKASVTRQAARELSLAPGKQVWLAIKTHSCYLLDEA